MAHDALSRACHLSHHFDVADEKYGCVNCPPGHSGKAGRRMIITACTLSRAFLLRIFRGRGRDTAPRSRINPAKSRKRYTENDFVMNEFWENSGVLRAVVSAVLYMNRIILTLPRARSTLMHGRPIFSA